MQALGCETHADESYALQTAIQCTAALSAHPLDQTDIPLFLTIT